MLSNECKIRMKIFEFSTRPQGILPTVTSLSHGRDCHKMSFLGETSRKTIRFFGNLKVMPRRKRQKAPETSYLDVACYRSSIGVIHHTSLGFNSEFWFLCFMLEISFNVMFGHFPSPLHQVEARVCGTWQISPIGDDKSRVIP